MKLSDIESKQLLPRFAQNISWVQDAFDTLVRNVAYRTKSIDAPLTLNSIQALTDEELQMYYEQFGVVSYYPDLSRETRENMLFELCRIYRYLGTPHAIETLCKYIFDGVDLDIKVHDNLAFDADGNLIDQSLLDVFDVEISPDSANLGPLVNQRILANIINFSRNSQALRDIYYEIVEDYELDIYKVEDTWNPQIIVDIENHSVCEPVVNPNTFDALLGLKYQYGDFQSKSFSYSSASNYWWSGWVDSTNKDEALAFGCEESQNTNNPAPLKNLKYQPSLFSYEIIGLYDDLAGTQLVPDFDLSDFTMTGTDGGTAKISCATQYPSSVTAMTYRVRITKI